jgi:hypothetical protein
VRNYCRKGQLAQRGVAQATEQVCDQPVSGVARVPTVGADQSFCNWVLIAIGSIERGMDSREENELFAVVMAM